MRFVVLHTLQWRHNERHGVPNHHCFDCLLNCVFRRRSKKTSKLCVTGLRVRGSHLGLANSPHKGSVTWKMFPFNDIIMYTRVICFCYGSWHNHILQLIETLHFMYNFLVGVCKLHYCDVIMGAVASQITSLTIVYSTIYSDADQRKHQSSASLALVREIHRGPVNSPHKWPVMHKMFPFDDVIMISNFGPHLPKLWIGRVSSNVTTLGLIGPILATSMMA